jgi:hypothetical protein
MKQLYLPTGVWQALVYHPGADLHVVDRSSLAFHFIILDIFCLMHRHKLCAVDHLEPKLEDIRAAVDFITEHQSRKEGVYIHCKGTVPLRIGAFLFMKGSHTLLLSNPICAEPACGADFYLRKQYIFCSLKVWS